MTFPNAFFCNPVVLDWFLSEELVAFGVWLRRGRHPVKGVTFQKPKVTDFSLVAFSLQICARILSRE